MTAADTCLDPQCMKCAEDEYQPGYTVEIKCELQPYCDSNKNFVPDGPASKDRLSVCRCMDGHHCASKACLTCFAHSRCAPGQRVQDKGSHDHDTKCQDCPPNTFSTEERDDRECHNWTVCVPGFQTKTSGTATSDTVCEQTNRSRVLLIIAVIPFTIALVVLFVCWKFKDTMAKKTLKQEVFLPGEKPLMIICHPQEEAEENEEEQVYPQRPLSSDGTYPQAETSPQAESGKSFVISQEESQGPLGNPLIASSDILTYNYPQPYTTNRSQILSENPL